MSKPIKIWFSDFWFPYQDNEPFFTPLLKKHFSIDLNPKPDVLIHSVFGKNYLKYQCTRVCYTAENTRPNFAHSDYHIGFDHLDHPNYLRWPNFLTYYKPDRFVKEKDMDAILPSKQNFCAFVVSNDKSQERIEFFKKLSTYKKVDSGGKTLNNLGYCVENKLEFIKNYKFTIAFENSSYPGYITEKIYEPFLVNSVPIYWGNPEAALDFNPKAFINAHDFKTIQELIDYIAYVDQHDEEYRKYILEPCFIQNKIPAKFEEKRVLEYFERIFSELGKHKPVARKTDLYYFGTHVLKSKIYKIRKKISL